MKALKWNLEAFSISFSNISTKEMRTFSTSLFYISMVVEDYFSVPKTSINAFFQIILYLLLCYLDHNTDILRFWWDSKHICNKQFSVLFMRKKYFFSLLCWWNKVMPLDMKIWIYVVQISLDMKEVHQNNVACLPFQVMVGC